MRPGSAWRHPPGRFIARLEVGRKAALEPRLRPICQDSVSHPDGYGLKLPVQANFR